MSQLVKQITTTEFLSSLYSFAHLPAEKLVPANDASHRCATELYVGAFL
ncbi:MAG: hypothetical protein K6L80_11010 [Agarilytica sp.]